MRGHHHNAAFRNTRKPHFSPGEEASFIHAVTHVPEEAPTPSVAALTDKQRRYWKTLVKAGWSVKNALLRVRGLL